MVSKKFSIAFISSKLTRMTIFGRYGQDGTHDPKSLREMQWIMANAAEMASLISLRWNIFISPPDDLAIVLRRFPKLQHLDARWFCADCPVPNLANGTYSELRTLILQQESPPPPTFVTPLKFPLLQEIRFSTIVDNDLISFFKAATLDPFPHLCSVGFWCFSTSVVEWEDPRFLAALHAFIDAHPALLHLYSSTGSGLEIHEHLDDPEQHIERLAHFPLSGLRVNGEAIFSLFFSMLFDLNERPDLDLSSCLPQIDSLYRSCYTSNGERLSALQEFGKRIAKDGYAARFPALLRWAEVALDEVVAAEKRFGNFDIGVILATLAVYGVSLIGRDKSYESITKTAKVCSAMLRNVKDPMDLIIAGTAGDNSKWAYQYPPNLENPIVAAVLRCSWTSGATGKLGSTISLNNTTHSDFLAENTAVVAQIVLHSSWNPRAVVAPSGELLCRYLLPIMLRHRELFLSRQLEAAVEELMQSCQETKSTIEKLPSGLGLWPFRCLDRMPRWSAFLIACVKDLSNLFDTLRDPPGALRGNFLRSACILMRDLCDSKRLSHQELDQLREKWAESFWKNALLEEHSHHLTQDLQSEWPREVILQISPSLPQQVVEGIKATERLWQGDPLPDGVSVVPPYLTSFIKTVPQWEAQL